MSATRDHTHPRHVHEVELDSAGRPFTHDHKDEAEDLRSQLEAAQWERDFWLHEASERHKELHAERTKREEALEVLRETLNYLPYPSGTSVVSKNQAQIRERVNNICQASKEKPI